MVSVPVFFAVIFPDAVTVATFLLLEEKLILLEAVLLGSDFFSV